MARSGNGAGSIHRTIRLLQAALESLHVEPALHEVESIAVMINRAMAVQGRSFHTPEHIFDLADPSNAYLTLAALFHDLVYVNVDQGFTDEVASILPAAVRCEEKQIVLPAGRAASDPSLERCLKVFGFPPGQPVAYSAGANELLSALVMNRVLERWLDPRDLIIATACIEATIPFRGPGPDGLSAPERLAGRLRALLGEDFGVEGVLCVQWAVRFANRDVANFAEEDVGRFLDNTWKLLPETNPSLRMGGLYSISSYRAALSRMEGFLRALDPATIFARYREEPAEELYRHMESRARRNVETAREYLGIKLLTAAILEALATLSGGDAPMALFMGDLSDDGENARVEEFLPKPPDRRDDEISTVLHDLLAYGRASSSSFDLRNSPLAHFIYLHLGRTQYRDGLALARQMYEQSLPADRFLAALPAAMIGAIAEACGRIAFTRERELRRYAASRLETAR